MVNALQNRKDSAIQILQYIQYHKIHTRHTEMQTATNQMTQTTVQRNACNTIKHNPHLRNRKQTLPVPLARRGEGLQDHLGAAMKSSSGAAPSRDPPARCDERVPPGWRKDGCSTTEIIGQHYSTVQKVQYRLSTIQFLPFNTQNAVTSTMQLTIQYKSQRNTQCITKHVTKDNTIWKTDTINTIPYVPCNMCNTIRTI